ncbi:MAG: hypothetical protein H7338_00420 [Candidatus Sericytochromatia bacterium]|nr:hypothetical protein [Candidatus Sericytochromatia bacterium]
MTKLDELMAAAAGLPPADLDALLILAKRLRVTMAPTSDVTAPAMDAESTAWMAADLAAPLEPYDWGDVDPLTLGRPVHWDAAEGAFVVVAGQDAG